MSEERDIVCFHKECDLVLGLGGPGDTAATARLTEVAVNGERTSPQRMVAVPSRENVECMGGTGTRR